MPIPLRALAMGEEALRDNEVEIVLGARHRDIECPSSMFIDPDGVLAPRPLTRFLHREHDGACSAHERPISLYISWRDINPPVCCRCELKAGLSGVRRLDFVDGPIFCDATPHPPRRPYFASLVTDALWHFDPRHESRDADGYSVT